MHDVEWEELHCDYDERTVVRIKSDRGKGKHHLSLNTHCPKPVPAEHFDTIAVWNAWVISSAMLYTLTTVYYIHSTYITHNWLMFICIQIINLFYSYVLFYVIAIKHLPNMISLVMFAYDRSCYMAKTIPLSRLIVRHRVRPEMVVCS